MYERLSKKLDLFKAATPREQEISRNQGGTGQAWHGFPDRSGGWCETADGGITLRPLPRESWFSSLWLQSP